MALPTGKQTSQGDFTPIEEGTYEVALKRASLSVESEYDTQAFNNGDGLQYQAINLTWDVDGEEWTERFIKVSLHERSKLFNRLSALFGRKIADGDRVDWGVSPEAEHGVTVDSYYKAKEDDPEKGVKKGQWVHTGHSNDGIEGALESIRVNGEELIGKRCLLAIDVNDKGYNRAAAGAASPLPRRAARRVEPEDDMEEDGEQEPPPRSASGRRRPAGAPA